MVFSTQHTSHLTMAHILLLGLFLSSIIYTVTSLHTSGQVITAVLDESVSIAAHEDCAKTGKISHRLDDNSKVTMATVENGTLTPGEKYGDRIKKSPSGFVLARVNHNDNGLYELTCGARAPAYIKLQVLVSISASVFAGDTRKLPCYSSTLEGAISSVRWERNKTLVLNLNVSDGKVAHGAGFDGRASFSSDWRLTGDLSLILERSQLEDAGEYVCFVLREEKVDLAVTRLAVDTPPACPPWTEAATVVTVVLSVVFIPAAILLGCKLKSRRFPWCRQSEDDVELHQSTNNNQEDGHQPNGVARGGEPKEDTPMNGHV